VPRRATDCSHGTGLEVLALIDTGATDVHVRPGLVGQIGLMIDGEVESANIGSTAMRPTTRVNVSFSNDADEVWTAYEARALVCEFDPCADIIIGMNVVSLMTVQVALGVPTLEVHRP
jgi:Aspartyl protease